MNNSKRTTPRSLYNVLSDIESSVSEGRGKQEAVIDIVQLKAQLDAIARALNNNDYSNAYSIMHPASKRAA